MTDLFATDLDQTMIFSPAAIARLGGALDRVAVETVDGAVISEMAVVVRDGLERLAQRALVVPATTRTVGQLARVGLPYAPRFAVAASGGEVLVDGRPDPGWARVARRDVADAEPLAAMAAVLHEATGLRVREADGWFCYTVGEGLDAAALEAPCAEAGWRVEQQGRKLYLLPAALDKAHALAYVVELAGASTVHAAGDSLLDLAMLAAADHGWVPAGSPASRATLPAHVAVTTAPGHAAAAEILAAW